MNAPIYVAAIHYIRDYEEADVHRRRSMERSQPKRYEASVNLVRIFDDVERRCPRPQEAMTEAYRADLVSRMMGSVSRVKEAAE